MDHQHYCAVLILAVAAQRLEMMQSPSEQVLHGSLGIVADGATLVPHEGTITCWISGDDLSLEVGRVAEVKDGQFTVLLPSEFSAGPDSPSPSIDFGRITVDGREAYCTSFKLGVDQPREIHVEAKWLPKATLTVRGVGTDDPIGQLELRCGSLDGMGPTLLEEVSSPVTLVPDRYVSPPRGWSTVRRWFVRAPGYAWGHVDVDHAVGGEHAIGLKGIGELVVSADSNKLHTLNVMISRIGDRAPNPWTQTISATQGYARFGGLPLGHYVVRSSLEEGGLQWPGPASTIEVRGNMVDVLNLKVDDSYGPQRISNSPEGHRVAFRLMIPDGWKVQGDRLPCLLIPKSASDSLNGRYETLELYRTQGTQWTGTASLDPGEWALKLVGIAWGTGFRVDSALSEVVGSVPNPAEIEVSCRDAASLGAVAGYSLYWDWADTHEAFFLGCEKLFTTSNQESVDLRVPEGRIVLHFRKSGWVPETYFFDASSSKQLVSVVLRKACTFEIHFRDGNVDAHVPHGIGIFANRLDGSGETIHRSSDQVRHCLEVSAPGAYRITVEPIAGYEPVASKVIFVSDKPNQIVNVMLSRSRSAR